MADVGCWITVCWEMFRVNSRVISGVFGGTVDCFIARNAAVSRGQINITLRRKGV